MSRSRSSSTAVERFAAARDTLAHARDLLRTAAECLHPASVHAGQPACPALDFTVPEFDQLDAAVDGWYTDLFTATGRSAVWSQAIESCPAGTERALALFDLGYAWYQLLGATRQRVNATPGWTGRMAELFDGLPLRIAVLQRQVGLDVPAGDHRAIYRLNISGVGIRAYFACSCGWEPRTMPSRMSTMHLPIRRHVRAQGLDPDNLAAPTYAAGYAAAGMTWDEWHAAHPYRDPFTGATNHERLAASRGEQDTLEAGSAQRGSDA